MNKIALGTKVYTITSASSLMYSETVRGALKRSTDPEFKDSEYTKIEFACDIDKIGVVIIPTPIKDVQEYFEQEESEGKVVGFEMKFTFREAREDELDTLKKICDAIQRRKTGFKPSIVN